MAVRFSCIEIIQTGIIRPLSNKRIDSNNYAMFKNYLYTVSAT